MHVGAVGLVVSTLGLAGCKSSSDRTTGQKFSDRQVARGVKKELSSDPTFKYSDVEATVYNGNVCAPPNWPRTPRAPGRSLTRSCSNRPRPDPLPFATRWAMRQAD